MPSKKCRKQRANTQRKGKGKGSKSHANSTTPTTIATIATPRTTAAGAAPVFDVEHLTLPRGACARHDAVAFVVRGVLTPDECKAWVQRSEQQTYRNATILGGRGKQRVDMAVRSSRRVMIDDVDAAAMVYARLQPHVPTAISGQRCVGLNERLRFLRYETGGYFAPHHDGAYRCADGSAQSKLTLMVYLNSGGGDDFAGGETRFVSMASAEVGLAVTPQRGDALVFSHDIFHEGSEVTRGRKYCVRTDVMFEVPLVGKARGSAC